MTTGGGIRTRVHLYMMHGSKWMKMQHSPRRRPRTEECGAI